MTSKRVKERLAYLRIEIEKEQISMSEIIELQGLADQIDPGDVLLLEWAGVPEFPEGKDRDQEGAEWLYDRISDKLNANGEWTPADADEVWDELVQRQLDNTGGTT